MRETIAVCQGLQCIEPSSGLVIDALNGYCTCQPFTPFRFLKPAMKSCSLEPPTPDELNALLRLLDDETPEVRAHVTARFARCGGDISEWLSTHAHSLNDPERQLLAEMLSPPRRETLTREWIVPTGGASALQEDWESFESLLRVLSDFLHDGISLRQPLSDALDLLAEEAAEEGLTTASELRDFLFKESRLTASPSNYYDPSNSDLAWCIEAGTSNPLGLCLIFILVGNRLNLEIEGVNFPGHFMCRIYEDGFPLIVDCFDHGRTHLQSTLLESPELSRLQRQLLRQSVGPGTILLRLLNNLSEALKKSGRSTDAELIQELRSTIE
jgi:regulator of sirC expression with transglutaminase-like and TPR domain